MSAKKQQKTAGMARAMSMTDAERKSLATKAAHARWKRDADGVAIATHEGVVRIGTIELACAVLKDGRRILSERSLSDAFTHVRSGAEYARRKAGEESQQLPVFVGKEVAAFLSDATRTRLAQPVRYRHANGWAIPAWGVDAELLPEICDAYLAAREVGALRSEAALRKASAAERLMRGLAKVGLVALIDEATGYQVERDKEELQRLLDRYVSEEFRPWTAMFPTEFYAQMFRLRNITTDDVRKRPQYFGKLTNDVIYSRLLPGVAGRLAEVNPTNESGRRTRKNHQHVQAKDHLREHITSVVFLMRTCTSWDDFIARLNAAAPKQASQLVTDE